MIIASINEITERGTKCSTIHSLIFNHQSKYRNWYKGREIHFGSLQYVKYLCRIGWHSACFYVVCIARYCKFQRPPCRSDGRATARKALRIIASLSLAARSRQVPRRERDRELAIRYQAVRVMTRKRIEATASWRSWIFRSIYSLEVEAILYFL